MNTTEYQIGTIEVPEKTKSYAPVAHIDLINKIKEELNRNNLQITNTKYRTNRDGKQLYGSYRLNQGDSELGWMINFVNSYDKSLALQIGIGAEVLVCSNGLIVNSKDVAIVRKHTGTIKEELEEKINDGVNKLGLLFDKITSIRDNLKNIPLTKREMSEYAGRMFIEDNVLTPNKISFLKSEINNSLLFKEDTAWDFYNHCTTALKKGNVSNMIKSHLNVHEFFESNIIN